MATSSESAASIGPTPASMSSPTGIGYPGGTPPTNRYSVVVLDVVLLILLALVFWVFIRIFATPLPQNGHDDSERRAIGRMVQFCYVFTLASLVTAILPLAALNSLPVSITTSFYFAMAESPVALVLGCVHYGNLEDRANEIACKSDRLANEWLVNIGGLVLQRLPYSESYPAGGSQTNGVAEPLPLASTDATTDWVDAHVGPPLYNLPPMTIHEGVTVPFYFVLIALFGGAVSLVRRVPEIQRRYLSQNDQLDAAGTRELLVSQILQFLSAPIIAVTAFAVFAPSGPSSSVVLAFISGFSSDAIIASFKAIADGIISSAKGAPAPPHLTTPAPTPVQSGEPLSPSSAPVPGPRTPNSPRT